MGSIILNEMVCWNCMTALFVSVFIFFLQFENLYSFILQILVEEFKKLCTRCVEKIITCT